MDKHTIRILALALLSLHLMFSATIVQCRTIADLHDEKINFPNGLCGKNKLCTTEYCYCCLIYDRCYLTIDACKEHCDNPPLSSSENFQAAETATATMTPAPLPTA
ncbi:hypothetical protein CFC21_014414 [Triticum aestivum]|uniref:Embryo surrounding factor 1 brassicaceae domain-containing protein n=2 Tax=Triticum aestivum TaxID=4565 RepID=A0A9R1DUD1_WHEAT|nr:uncharacterized protein LOC119358566 [Triticum dicoccoides]XP_048551971.1 uncharacterized protein LOC125531708 [Triticum urartu]KAF6998281.1 hypothetical protein CFC21_014414 [Triticum aestivum]